jgi:hypothetical protein
MGRYTYYDCGLPEPRSGKHNDLHSFCGSHQIKVSKISSEQKFVARGCFIEKSLCLETTLMLRKQNIGL